MTAWWIVIIYALLASIFTAGSVYLTNRYTNRIIEDTIKGIKEKTKEKIRRYGGN